MINFMGLAVSQLISIMPPKPKLYSDHSTISRGHVHDTDVLCLIGGSGPPDTPPGSANIGHH